LAALSYNDTIIVFRLAQRLMEVARKEHLKTDLGTLLMLCDKTGNDIRSCLSFLHFFKTQKKVVRLTDVQSSSVGQKDSQRGLFAVWHEMFQITKPKKYVSAQIFILIQQLLFFTAQRQVITLKEEGKITNQL
jgi:hypothetical protein